MATKKGAAHGENLQQAMNTAATEFEEQQLAA